LPRRKRLPAVDEAFALFAAALLLTFYIAPSLRNLNLFQMTFIVEIALIAGPAILFAIVGRYRVIETFSLRKPGIFFLAGAALVAVGSVPWIELLMELQSKFWPPNPDTQRQMSELFLPALRQHPLLLPIAIGLLAGICEEILFRGPIQAGLIRRMPKGFAITITAILFAAAHLDVQGMPLRTLLGLFLGWLVATSGSIFPAMLAHAAYDATALFVAAWAVTHGAGDLTGTSAAPVVHFDITKLALGSIGLFLGALLLISAIRRHKSTSPITDPRQQPLAV
jgi:membrane protease YdiL (CAAX protease family)